jgi:hypothetical protein
LVYLFEAPNVDGNTGSDLAFPVEPSIRKAPVFSIVIGSKLKLPVVCGISTPHFGSGSAAKAGAAIKMMGKALSTLIAAIMGAASAWLISNLYLAVVHLLRGHVKSRMRSILESGRFT